MVFFSTGKFSSVSPPKNVRCATLFVARLLQHEVDALPRRLLAHELRLLAVLGVDDLVLAVLVAVGAARLHWLVTFSTIVVSGNGVSGMIFGGGGCGRRGDLADRAHARQLARSWRPDLPSVDDRTDALGDASSLARAAAVP